MPPWDVLITADGAVWIENMCVAHFLNADILLDIFHAGDNVQTMLKNLFPRDEKQRDVYFNRLRGALLILQRKQLYLTEIQKIC